MGNLDYVKIIDEYNDQAFRCCVELLFPLLDYKFLTRDDIRRIDLKERVLELIPRYVPVKNKKPTSGLDRYGTVLKFYFDNYLPCKPDSIASRYRTVAMEKVKEILSGNQEIDAAEDLFMVFLAMMRNAAPDFDKKIPIENISFLVQRSDGDLLKQIRDYPFALPVAPIAAAVVQAPIVKGVIKPNLQAVDQKQFAYINNVFLYCRMMQAQGEFTEGDDGDVKAG